MQDRRDLFATADGKCSLLSPPLARCRGGGEVAAVADGGLLSLTAPSHFLSKIKFFNMLRTHDIVHYLKNIFRNEKELGTRGM